MPHTASSVAVMQSRDDCLLPSMTRMVRLRTRHSGLGGAKAPVFTIRIGSRLQIELCCFLGTWHMAHP